MNYITHGPVCQHCGYIHNNICPRIKAIEYYENGTIKRVEYHEFVDKSSKDLVADLVKYAQSL